ncbi:MAG: peptidase [Pseudonocardiales bacterium]|nr:peptidase [Pseudonocardiales bacterium]
MNAARPYLRFPHVNGADVVFVADDDVWTVPTSGGRAVRLTSDRVPVARPKLSPDATLVAWTSRRDGAPEVHAMPLAGGTATRLTFWGTPGTRLLGWSDDANVVAASPTGQPFRTYSWAYELPIDGSPARRLPYGPIGGLAVHPAGPVVTQSMIFQEPANWKRYRGGTAAKLWFDAKGTGEFAPFLRELNGQLADPVWIGDRVLFCSDHEGHANIYSVDPKEGVSSLRRHSDHEGMYARNLGSDGTRAVYQCAGDIWLIDSLGPDAEPTRLEITLPGSRSARLPATFAAAEELGELAVDETGRASVVELRGTIQWLTHLDGPVRSLAERAGSRARLPRVAGVTADGRPRTIAWITDAEGDDALDVLIGGASESTRVLSGQLGRVLELAVSPSGDRVALATHDGRVLVAELSSAPVVAREITRNEFGDASGLTFSPDSQWLAFSAPHLHPLRSIVLAAFEGGQVIDATGVRFVDTNPVFTADGKHLAFLSARTYDPVYDAHNFELSFPVGTRPYLLPLAADTPSPFDPELAGRALSGSEPPEGGSDPDESTEGAAAAAISPAAASLDESAKPAVPPPPPATRVDVDGLAERIVAVPVAAGLYTDLLPAKDGLLWLDHPLRGEIGADRPVGAKSPRATLVRWDFAKRRLTDLVEGVDSFAVSGDGTRIVVHDEDELRVGPSDHKVEDPAPGEVVTVDLSRVRVVTDPAAEWRQMLNETWRLMRDHFWVEDMAGVDWNGVLARYLPVVERIATRDDLSEVLWEMIAELGTSHAYERFVPAPPPPGRAAAFLGADLDLDDDGRWRVARVLPGESSVPSARSPLAAAGVAVGVGAVLLAVNGRPIGSGGPAPLLAGMADRPVELTVLEDGRTRSVAVVPLADEVPLRYQAWVADRRDYVHSATGGRVGYVHVPDMVSTGWAEFNRDLRAEVACEALVVDTRENGGGHTSQLVIERLSRRIVAWEKGRHLGGGSYPNDAPRGPLVSIANEMAGSDGDIVNQAFKSLQLGPVVGTRTWGGVIGIDGRYDLIDGTGVTQPRYPFWFVDVGWGVENYGVDPDVEVLMPPQAWVAAADPQLDAGISIVLEALATHTPVQMPPVSTRPSRRAPVLPARPGR